MAWHRIALGLTLAVSLLLTLTGLAQEAPLENTAGTVETTGEETIPALDDPAPPAQTAGRASPILFSDNFDDPAAGRLPRTSANPALYLRGYVDGQYQLAKVDPSWDRAPAAVIPGRYTDLAVGVDVRFVGEVRGRSAFVTCRTQSDGSEYRLVIAPGAQEVRLVRLGGDSFVTLLRHTSGAVRPEGEVNRIELGCFGPNITGTINGFRVLALEDSTYAEGTAFLGFSALEATGDARFDNLVVSRELAPNPQPAPPAFTPTPGRPTATPRPPTPTPGPNDGVWGGRNSTSDRLDFTVVGNQIVAVSLEFAVRGNSCSASGTFETRLQPPVPIDNNAFSVETAQGSTFRFSRPGTDSYETDGTVTFRITGRLTSPTAANGNFDYAISVPGAEVPCQGSVRGTWSASR